MSIQEEVIRHVIEELDLEILQSSGQLHDALIELKEQNKKTLKLVQLRQERAVAERRVAEIILDI